MVKALVHTLKGLEENVDLAEFLRLVQYSVIVNNNAISNYQTPQVAISPHTKLVFLKRFDGN
jgi:hypothetical protein